MTTYRTHRAAFALVLALVAFSASGCVKHVALTPAQTVTLSLNQALATIAAANDAVSTDVISVAGAGYITHDLANQILGYNRTVAQAVLTGVTLQKGTLSDTDKAIQIRALLGTLKLPADVQALLQGPQGTPMVASLITTIVTLEQVIVAITGGK